MDTNLKDHDVLLVKEKGKEEFYAAATDRDGKVKSTSVTGDGNPDFLDNPDFLKIDRFGGILENFFKNFMRQVKNPTQFEFFRIPTEKFSETLKALQDAFKKPDRAKNRDFIEMHRVDPETFLKDRQNRSTASPDSLIHESNAPWLQLENIGVSRETLERTGNLEKLLNWQKTDLLPISVSAGNITVRTDARLALRETSDGDLSVSVHALRRKPELDRPWFGVGFSPEDRENLLKTGNLGRIAEAEYRKGEKTPVYLSVDRQTNELVAFRADRVKIPESIKSLTLSELQKEELSEGKSVWIEGMTSKKGTPFNAFVQFNADRRGFEFRFDSDRKQDQGQNHENRQNDIPQTFRSRELTDGQRDSLGEGKTVYVDGLVDKKGRGYSGYVTLNKETGKPDFMFPKDYREALAAGQVIPDDRHGTQVAVNSEGKTGEATKELKEPLDRGQTQPTEKQAEKQREKPEKPRKSKGLKM
jgi:hypothetical protein